jgi:hypothetical protein
MGIRSRGPMAAATGVMNSRIGYSHRKGESMNSLKDGSEPEAVKPHAGDYFIVSGENSTWYVSTRMARFIETVLDAEPEVRWVKFVDLSGSRVRLRTRQIDYICQCTADQRHLDREFSRALTRERKSDRSWGEDE